MPHGSGLAQGGDSSLARPQLGVDAPPSHDPPAEVSDKAQRPADRPGPRVCFAQPIDFCAVALEAARALHGYTICAGCSMAQINILLGYSPPLPSGFFRRELGSFAVSMTSRIVVTLV